MKQFITNTIDPIYEQEYLKEKEEHRHITKKEWLEIFPEAGSYLTQNLIDNLERVEKLKDLYSKWIDSMNEIEGLKVFGIQIGDCFIGEEIEKAEHKIKEIHQYLDLDLPMTGKITQKEIENAKNYPFENLVKVNRSKFALCPFHEDKKPSFYIKNNWGHCFSCGKSVDTIAFVMETESIDFITAIRRLQ